MENIHSIWVEDEQSSKFHLNDPNLKILNSQVPLLSSKETIELPPLPPSSFFTSLSKNDETSSSKGSIRQFFKKLGNSNDNNPKKKTIRKKISTPFGFNHISHIDNQTQEKVITVQQLSHTPTASTSTTTTNSTTSKRGSHSAKAFCTSPQIPGFIPRSISNATTLSNTSSTQMFTRSGSISTMATTISSNKSHSKKPSTQIQGHTHQDSSSSIENLKKLEKSQISKQCSVDYTSNYTFPNQSDNNSKPKRKSLNNWDTPDPQSVVRQSWIYEDLSPMKPLNFISPKSSNQSLRKTRANSIGGESPYLLASPMKKDLNLFQNEMETVFNKDEIKLSELISSIDDFTKFFKQSSSSSSSSPSPTSTMKKRFTTTTANTTQPTSLTTSVTNLSETKNEENDDSEDDSTIASLRAARFSRLSRLENFYQHDPRYLSFLESVHKSQNDKTMMMMSSTTSKIGEETLEDGSIVPEVVDEEDEFEEYEEYEEEEFDEGEERESTPTQHQLGILLPSVM